MGIVKDRATQIQQNCAFQKRGEGAKMNNNKKGMWEANLNFVFKGSTVEVEKWKKALILHRL